MGTERFWKIHWIIAVWHNVIGGVGVLVLGDWLYQREGLEPPSPGVNYLRWALLILVFGYTYYLIYKDLYNTEKLVWIGVWGKMASASSDVYYLVFKTGVAHIFWVTVCTDYICVITFVLFIRWVRQQKTVMARAQTG